MSQIFLFTGENAYALREEKRMWISEFVKKHGEENFLPIAVGRSLTFRALLDAISVAPFIGARRLVLLDGLPSLSKEEVAFLPRHIHPQVILLIVEPKLDKRTAVAKQFLEIAEVKEFEPLKGRALLAWVQSFLATLGSSMEPAAVTLLLELIGESQDMLAEELRKLALATSVRPIVREDVEELAVPTFEGVIWKLTDLLCAGKRSEALLYAHRYVDRGGDPYGLWAVLLGMLKNLVAVHVAQREGSARASELASDLQVHVLALRSLLPYSSRVEARDLRVFLEDAVDADIGLKTGAYRATAEAPEELLALIDRFILMAPR